MGRRRTPVRKPGKRNTDPAQRGIRLFCATPNPRSADNKENDVVQKKLASPVKEEDRRDNCITVSRSRVPGRSETPESNAFFQQFPKPTGLRRGATTSPKKGKSTQRSGTGKLGRRSSEVTPREAEELVGRRIDLVHDVPGLVAPASSRAGVSSPLSFVTATDGLSPSTTSQSPDTAPTTVSKTSSTEDIHLSAQSPQKTTPSKPGRAEDQDMGGVSSSNKDSLKRPHPENTSTCPRVDEHQPNKRLRSRSASPEKTLPNEPSVVTLTSSPPVWQEAEEDPSSGRLPSPVPTQHQAAAPSSSFLLPPLPESRESSAISILSRTPTPLQRAPSPSLPPILPSSQRIESLKSSWRSVVVPSSQSDENAEPLDEPEEDDMAMITHDLIGDDEDELGLDVPSSSPKIVPGSGLPARKHDEIEDGCRASSPLSDYDSDDSDRLPEMPPTSKTVKKPEEKSADVYSDEDHNSDLLSISGTKTRRVSPVHDLASNQRTTRSATGSLSLASYRAKSLAPVSAPRPQYKFSLSNLLKHDQREKSAQEEIERARAVLAKDDDDSDEASFSGQTERQSRALAGLVNEEDDEGKVGKVFEVMSRASAHQTRTTFHFCDVNSEVWRQAVPTFPQLPLGSDENLSSLKDDFFREQAFVTGFARRMFEFVKPPKAVRGWLLHASIRELRARLRHAYLDCYLASCTENSEPVDNNDMEILLGLFKGKDGDDPATMMEPIQHPVNATKRQPPPQLVHAIRALGQIVPQKANKASKTSFLSALLQLAMDDELMHDVVLHQAYDESLTALIDSLIEDSTERNLVIPGLCRDFNYKVRNSHLQSHLIDSLPCSTPSTHEFRRRLALSFFLDSDIPCDAGSLNSTWAHETFSPLILNVLNTHDSFHITDSTCYTTIHARIRLLDAAIDCGFSPVFPLATAPPDSDNASTRTSPITPAALKAARNAHNACIDSFLKPLRRLNARIVDATAMGDGTRTEAKNAIERLVFRLQRTVRVGGSGGARMGGVWDDAEDAETNGRKRESLDGWAVKKDGATGERRVKFEGAEQNGQPVGSTPTPEQDYKDEADGMNVEADPEATLVGTDVDPEATVVEADV